MSNAVVSVGLSAPVELPIVMAGNDGQLLSLELQREHGLCGRS